MQVPKNLADSEEGPGDLDAALKKAEKEVAEVVGRTKVQRVMGTDAASKPTAYRKQSMVEKVALEYIANFRKKFVQLYPQRPALLLCPQVPPPRLR